MGLLEKILLKNKEADAPMVQEDENIENTQQKINIEDFPLAPVEFDDDVLGDIITPKEAKNRVAAIRQGLKYPPAKTTALQLSTKKLMKMQNDLKNLKVMQVENIEGDIIPEGIISGKFEIERALDSKRWYYNLLTSGGSIIGASRPYSSVSAAMNGINSIIANAKKASVEDQTLRRAEILPFPKWVLYLDNNERFNFILYASNGNAVIHSHGYATKQSCKKGIDSVIGACKNPMIEKTYLHNKE